MIWTGAIAPRTDAARPRRRGRVLRSAATPVPPTRIEASYEAALERLVAAPIIDVTRALLLPALPDIVASTNNAINPHSDSARLDGYRDTIRFIIARMSAELERAIVRDDVDREIVEASEAVSRHSADNARRAFERSVRLTPYLGDAAVAEQMATWARENADLITSLRTRYLDDVATMTVRAVGEGRRHESIARAIEDRFLTRETRDPRGQKRFRGVTYQARRTARDQVSKLNGDLDRIRYTALGVTSYVWRTLRDERVRPEHAEREGRVFRYDDPPEDGNPGQAIQCRCFSEPLFD